MACVRRHHQLNYRIVEENWTSRNPRAERLLAVPHHGFQNEAEHFTEEEYNQYPIYTELMKPSGYGFGAATAITVPNGDNLIFSVEKKLANGPVDRKGIDYLDLLRPHLARSAMTSSRLEFERITVAVEALQMTGLPSAVIGFDGQTLAVNSLLEEFAPQVKLGAFDRLLFAHRPANLFMTEAIARAEDSAGPSAFLSRSFPLPQLDNSPAAIVHLVPVRGNARDLFSRAAFFLIITPVDRKRVPAAETIQGLFDLTPAEARVARCLATGGNVPAVAGMLSVRPKPTCPRSQP